MAGQTVAQAADQTGSHFIHGSWVNVREAGDPSARVIDKLVTNTPVNVVDRQGSWCQINYGEGKNGHVSCDLLGGSALTLAQTATQPARAFWVAPSPNRLVAYGQSLPIPPAFRLSELRKRVQAGDVVRYPPIPEFDAAKKVMKDGVLLNPAHETNRGTSIDIAQEMSAYSVRPAPIRPSLFRTHESVALVSEADADGLAAIARKKVSLVPEGLPRGWFQNHSGPEIDGVSGFWDVGSASLSFAQPLIIYSVASNGLVGAKAVRKLPFAVGEPPEGCGSRYTGKSLPSMAHMVWSAPLDHLEYDPVPGYPALEKGVDVLTSFAVPQTFQRQSAKIKTQSQALTKLPKQEFEVNPERIRELGPKVILYEVDLDGDGVTDVMLLEKPMRFGEVTLDIVRHRSWYLNINGEWFKAGDWEDQDCT